MNDFLSLEISSAGMSAQRMRMRIVAENLANQHTTGPDGPYRRKDVILESRPVQSFEDQMERAIQTQGGEPAAQSVAVTEVRTDGSQPLMVYDPTHPHADANGYVAYPNISIIREMTDMMEASRSYEANLAAARAARDMLTAALDLARG